MNKGRQLLMISVLILGACQAARAANYYVDYTSGADANSGTSESAPWQTLGKVNATSFQPGDTINFKRGRVWTGELQVNNNGTAVNPITYQSYAGGALPQIKNPGVNYGNAINITGDYTIIQNFLLTDAHQAGILINTGADHTIVKNNEITRVGIGVMTFGQYTLMTKNYVHDLTMIVNDAAPFSDYGAVCFWLQGANNEISYNRGINCIATSQDFGYDGGFVEVYNQGDNSYIHHNYAENTEGFFELGASGGGSAQNVTVAYNVIYNSANGGVCINTGANAITITNFQFENNTFVSTGGHGYRVFQCIADLSPLQVRNNIFYSNIQIADNGTFTHTNNIYHMVNMINGSGVGYTLGAGELTGNPLFVNVGAGDLHLQTGSPAIDAGISAGYSEDYEGKAVPIGSAPDMGAYEYGGAIMLSPPPNLRVSS